MKDEVQAWLAYAKRDFEDAQALIEASRYHGSLYFLQQTVEKAIKGYLIAQNVERVPFVHDIRYLLEVANLTPPADLHLNLKEISLVYTRIRYPDMNTAHYSDNKVVKDLIRQFTELYTWIQTQFKNN